MKYLKRFNEGILDDVRSEVDKTRSSISSKFGRFSNVEDEFNDDSFEVTGKLEIQGGSSKTPVIKIRSMNKTIDGTSLLSGDIMAWDLTKFDGQEVTIKGTTKNGEKPSFMNPIMFNEIQ
jgi:hypothetical protein